VTALEPVRRSVYGNEDSDHDAIWVPKKAL
jgi:hypothetical protein